MLKSTIFQSNILRSSEESEKAKSFNNCLVDLQETHITIVDKSKKTLLDSELTFHNQDVFTDEYIGKYSNSNSFRLIRPKPQALDGLKQRFNCISAFSLASLSHDEYAVHFILVNQNAKEEMPVSDKGAKEQIQKLIQACLISFDATAHDQFLVYSKRLLNIIDRGSDLLQYESGKVLLMTLRYNVNVYNDDFRKKILI